MVQQTYYLDNYKNLIRFIRGAEHKFHNNYTPLYANHLFCNSMVMYKIGRCLTDFDPLELEGLIVTPFEIDGNETDKLNNGAISCGLELVNGKVDYEVNYQIAKYSHNVFIFCFNSINDDDLLLVRDENLSDNTFVLKHIHDSDNNDEQDDVNIEISTPMLLQTLIQ